MSAAIQQKNYVTYTIPSDELVKPSITLLESRLVLAGSGTTGLRTWEAALALATFLASPMGRGFIDGKIVLELGAGTGLISILCAKYFGAKFVLATDGSGEVIDDLDSNLFINGLAGSRSIKTTVLKWGHALTSSVKDRDDHAGRFDIVLGADLVSKAMSGCQSFCCSMRVVVGLLDLYIDVFQWFRSSSAASNSYNMKCGSTFTNS